MNSKPSIEKQKTTEKQEKGDFIRNYQNTFHYV